MGFANVSLVIEHWGHLPGEAYKLLIKMARISRDRDVPPRYFAGRDELAAALGRPIADAEARRRAFKAVERAVAELKRAGVITQTGAARIGRQAEYELHLSIESPPKTGDLPSGQSTPESGGHSNRESPPLFGQEPPENRGESPPLSGQEPPENRGAEDKGGTSKEVDRTYSGTPRRDEDQPCRRCARHATLPIGAMCMNCGRENPDTGWDVSAHDPLPGCDQCRDLVPGYAYDDTIRSYCRCHPRYDPWAA